LHCPPTTFKCPVLFLVPQTSFQCQVELQISVHRGFQTPQCPEVSPWCLSTALHEWHLKKYALGKVVVCFGIICMCCTLLKCIQVRNGAKLHFFCIAFASFFLFFVLQRFGEAVVLICNPQNAFKLHDNALIVHDFCQILLEFSQTLQDWNFRLLNAWSSSVGQPYALLTTRCVCTSVHEQACITFSFCGFDFHCNFMLFCCFFCVYVYVALLQHSSLQGYGLTICSKRSWQLKATLRCVCTTVHEQACIILPFSGPPWRFVGEA